MIVMHGPKEKHKKLRKPHKMDKPYSPLEGKKGESER